MHQGIRDIKHHFQGDNDIDERRVTGETGNRKHILSDEARLAIESTANAFADKYFGADSCVFSDREQKTVKRACGMLADVGGGDGDKGVEAARESIKFVGYRQSLEKDIGRWTIRGVLLAILSGSLAALWYGIRYIILKEGG